MAEIAPLISVVIPAYNESKNISQGALQTVADYFSKQVYQYEVLIVDDGSTDDTANLVRAFIADKPAFRLLETPHKGKALAVHIGVDQSQGAIVLFTDLDQATPPEEVEKLLPFLEKRDYDIAIGSREIMGAKREQEPFHRHLMGKGFNFIVQLIAVRNIHDTQCGFKVFKAHIAKQLFNQLKVYQDTKATVKGPLVTAFDVELLFLAQKYHYRIAEVPVFWHHVKSERVNPLKDSYRMFIDVLKIRLNDMMGKYDTKTRQ